MEKLILLFIFMFYIQYKCFNLNFFYNTCFTVIHVILCYMINTYCMGNKQFCEFLCFMKLWYKMSFSDRLYVWYKFIITLIGEYITNSWRFCTPFGPKRFTNLPETMRGQVVVITGANTGIGKVNATLFARLGAKVMYYFCYHFNSTVLIFVAYLTVN